MSTANTTAWPNFGLYNLPPDSEGLVMVRLNIFLITFSTILLFGRLYVRAFMVKVLGLDDLLASISWCVLVSLSSMEIVTVGLGSGTHLVDVPLNLIPKFFSNLVTLQMLYFWGVGLARMSMAAFYLRLSQDRMYTRCIYTVASFTLAATFTAFFFELFECKHVPDLWDVTVPTRQCLAKAHEAPMMWTHGAFGIFIDCCLVALPTWVIYTKMKWSAKTIQVLLVFSIGIFGVVTGVVRLIININTDFTTDTTFKMVRVAPWTDIEGHIGLWTACFPALQPIIRIVSYKLGIRSTVNSTHKRTGGATNPSGNAYFQKGSHTRSRGYVSYNDDKEDRLVTVKGGSSSSDKDLELTDMDFHGGTAFPTGGGIRKTTDVRVQIAEPESPPGKWDAL